MITPPIIGAAIRFITSAPAPWLHMIGSKPIRIAMIVITFGRMRFTAPSIIASWRSSIVSHASLGAPFFVGVLQIEKHDHAGFSIHSGQRDNADPNGDAHVVSQ